MQNSQWHGSTRSGLALLGKVGMGTVRYDLAMSGTVEFGKVRMQSSSQGRVRRDGFGWVRCGMARFGRLRPNAAWQGCDHPFRAWRDGARYGRYWSGMVGCGLIRSGTARWCRERWGGAWYDKARMQSSFHGRVWQVLIRYGVVRSGCLRCGRAGSDVAWQGCNHPFMARFGPGGMVRHGMAALGSMRQGKLWITRARRPQWTTTPTSTALHGGASAKPDLPPMGIAAVCAITTAQNGSWRCITDQAATSVSPRRACRTT